MHVVSHHSRETLDKLVKKERNARRWLRLQVILRAKQGETAPEIATALRVSRRTVQEWVQRYNADGLKGLKDRRRSNHRYLTAEQESRLQAYLDAEAEDPHRGVRRAEDLRRWIECEFGVLYSLTGIYRLLERLGFSHLMPRPRHRQADPAAQEAFKKKRWIRSGASPGNTPTSASKSGSRTRHDSDNRAR